MKWNGWIVNSFNIQDQIPTLASLYNLFTIYNILYILNIIRYILNVEGFIEKSLYLKDFRAFKIVEEHPECHHLCIPIFQAVRLYVAA